MANEFVAKNGLISQNNTTVSGSLTVTQGITGSLFGTASNIQGGLSTYIPLWATNTRLTSSYLNQFDGPFNKGIQTIYLGASYGLYLDLPNYYYRLGSSTGLTYANLTLDETNGYFRANYNGADNGLDLTFSTNTYAFGNLPGNQKITIDTNSEIISIADQAPAGIKVEGGGVRTVTIGDVWANSGTGTQAIINAISDTIILTTTGGTNGIKAEGSPANLVTIGDYAGNTTSTKIVVDSANSIVQVTGSFSVQNGAEFLGQVILTLGNYGDDTEAAANGVPINGLYRNGNVVSIRIT